MLLFCQGIFSQESTHWQFGSNGFGMHFGGSFPELSDNGYTPYGWAGCGVLNNPNHGNLIFYTDGQKVIDRNHEVMPNGNGLNSGNSTHSTGKICERIGYPGQYYVFSIETATESNDIGSLYYSVVDTTLQGNGSEDNPLGDVADNLKNQLITGGVSESLMLIKGDDKIWLLSPQFNDPVIEIFLIDGAGINYHSSFDFGISLVDLQAISYSPASHKLALGSFGENDPILIFDFDPELGSLSSPEPVPGSFGTSSNQFAGIIDLEWSPDGTKLYLSKYRGYSPLSGGKLFQYDLNNPGVDAVLLHQISTTNTHVAKGLRLGPDGKIYWLYVNPNTNETDHLAAILNPNDAGSDCNLDLEYLSTGYNLNYTNLFPTMATTFKDDVANNDNTMQVESDYPLITLFPNPANDKLNIAIDSSYPNYPFHYFISDLSGKIILADNLYLSGNKAAISIRELSSGQYLLTVHNGFLSLTSQFTIAR